MGWQLKDQPTNFDQDPIEGLYFINGDYRDKRFPDGIAPGYKFAQIRFPSGVIHQVWEGETSPIVNIFGELDLPFHIDRNQAFEIAFDIGEQCGYFAAPVGDNQLELIGGEDHLLVTYDNDRRVMVNSERVKREQPSEY